ncbi:MAG: type II secretion system F family protein [Clostridia bacterium]|nr:type II secretion system F family protein [Clostridia bacterium]
MATFTYTAIDSSGKQVKGSVAADSQDAATAKVKELGVTPISVAQGSALNADINLSFMQKGPKPRDISVFCRQMVSILGAGVGMSDALGMVAGQTENPVLKNAIAGCREKIEQGSSLSEAMSEYPKAFEEVFCTMVAAGEESGSLDISFTRMGESAEKTASLKALIKKSTMYPMVLGIVVVVVVFVMLTFIVPKFESFLGSLGSDLPAFTKALVAAGNFCKNNVVYIVLFAIGFIVFIKRFKKTNVGKHIFGKISMNAPVVKNLTVKTACANLMRTLSTMLATGINMVDAIEITGATMTNVFYAEALDKIKDEVALGTPLSEAIEHTGVFPDMVFHMAAIGEETGNLVQMFDTTADYYDEEVKAATESLTALLEPMVIVALAGIVGPIVIALLMPMMSMYSSLSEM